jgi:hypothetical protein
LLVYILKRRYEELREKLSKNEIEEEDGESEYVSLKEKKKKLVIEPFCCPFVNARFYFLI